MKALGIGEIVLDKSYILDGYPMEDSKVVPEKVKYSLGGPVAAALIILARHGVECTFLTSIGNDRQGKILIKKLAQEGIRVIGEKKGQTKVNIYLINKNSGSRTGIKSEVRYSPIKKVPLDVLSKTDVILADRHETQALRHAIIHKNSKTKVIIDPSTEISSKTEAMIRDADYPIIPLEMLDTLSPLSRNENLKKLYALAKKPFLITAGSKGSYIYNGKDIVHIKPLDVSAIDTLGAGDVYRAGIAWGVLKKWDLVKSAQYANLVSGLQCTRYGNGSALPTREEVHYHWETPRWKNVIYNLI